MEAVAETSEEFMERYFNGEEFSEDEIRQALRVNVADGSIVPVLMGSNTLARGMYTLLVDIVKYLPSPEKRSCTGINAKTNEVYSADYDFFLHIFVMVINTSSVFKTPEFTLIREYFPINGSTIVFHT